MSEKQHSSEAAPKLDPYKVFEALTEKGVWSSEVEATLNGLFESHEDDLYMIYRTYEESGLVDELSEYEQRLYEWLKNAFEETAAE